MKKSRLPTEEEKEQFLDYCMLKNNDTSKQTRSDLKSMRYSGDTLVAVFDNYATYMSEYQGKVIVLIGDINPRGHQTML
jgi:hypothetical protein